MKTQNKPEKNPAAQTLARQRWAKTTPRQRASIARWVASHGAGRPRTKAKRCPCQAMTLKLARIRADRNGTGLGHLEGCSFYRAPLT
jgi:hypothetical protein